MGIGRDLKTLCHYSSRLFSQERQMPNRDVCAALLRISLLATTTFSLIRYDFTKNRVWLQRGLISGALSVSSYLLNKPNLERQQPPLLPPPEEDVIPPPPSRPAPRREEKTPNPLPEPLRIEEAPDNEEAHGLVQKRRDFNETYHRRMELEQREHQEKARREAEERQQRIAFEQGIVFHQLHFMHNPSRGGFPDPIHSAYGASVASFAASHPPGG